MPPTMPSLNDDCEEVMNGLADGSVGRYRSTTSKRRNLYCIRKVENSYVKDSMRMEIQGGNSVLKMQSTVYSNRMSQAHGEPQVLTVSHSISEERMLLLVRYV